MESRPPRLRFDSLRIESEGENEWVEVDLRFGSRLVTGRSPAVDAENTVAGVRRAAVATLDAVQRFSHGTLKCALADISFASVGREHRVVLIITVETGGRSQSVFGSCKAGGDIVGASCRAILNAINAFIEPLTSDAA